MPNDTNLNNGRASVDQTRQALRDKQLERKQTGDHDPLKAVPAPGLK